MSESPRLPSLSSNEFFGPLAARGRHPLHGQWELTCRCNLHCVMCYTDPFNTPQKVRTELMTDEIFRILDEIAEAGCLELVLTGGEPLARPDFFEIYERAHEKGFLLTVFSNGTLIDEEVADRFATRPPARIEISMHGFSREVFERVTAGKGSYDRCIRGIELLLERRVPLTLKTTAMTLNAHEVIAIKRYVNSLAKEADVQYRLGEEMRTRLDGSDDPGEFQLSDGELRLMEARDPELIIAHQKEAEEEARTPYSCQSGFRKFHIDAYGQLQLCSGNRRMSYDLRKGSFREGFYQFLPTFPCPYKLPNGQKAASGPDVC